MFHEQPAGLLVLQELPEETQTEKELRQSSMTVVEQIQDSINGLTLDDKVARYEVKFQNQALENLFGEVGVEKQLHTPSLLLEDKLHSLHQLTKKNIQDLHEKDIRVLDREDHINETYLAQRHESSTRSLILAEKERRRNPRPEKWVNINRQDIIFDNQRCLLISMHDVSQRHKLSEQQKQIEMLKKLQSTISEDLIDPLSMMGVSSSWLIKWYRKQGEANPEILQKLQQILIASKMSYFKCCDLLQFSDSAKLSSARETNSFYLSKVTKEISEIIDMQASGRHISINVDYKTRLLQASRFLGHPARYQQVLYNLLSNAVKFSKNGEKIKVELSSQEINSVAQD